eukprot:TRINITY_DN59876_c0_g1_i1.p1 TRINITY_DN59876_c0_g1~~TRINITY_DN59876_c0_g1_i1.p1  ORF type:complete len:381 (-),score=36.49 TRINITY_DN59876_c0_g1_i1:87-1229(-)
MEDALVQVQSTFEQMTAQLGCIMETVTKQASAFQQFTEILLDSTKCNGLAFNRKHDDRDDKDACQDAACCKGEDIIKLNVGGTTFTTTRETLLKEKDSFFWAMLHRPGQWKATTQTDDEILFIDRSPDSFGLILDYLRAADANIGDFPVETLSEHQRWVLHADVDFFQLHSLMDKFNNPRPRLLTWDTEDDPCIQLKHSGMTMIIRNPTDDAYDAYLDMYTCAHKGGYINDKVCVSRNRLPFYDHFITIKRLCVDAKRMVKHFQIQCEIGFGAEFSVGFGFPHLGEDYVTAVPITAASHRKEAVTLTFLYDPTTFQLTTRGPDGEQVVQLKQPSPPEERAPLHIPVPVVRPVAITHRGVLDDGYKVEPEYLCSQFTIVEL